MNSTEAKALEQATRDKLSSSLWADPYPPTVSVTEVSVTLDGDEAIVCVRYQDTRHPDEQLGARWRIPSWMETNFEGGLDVDWLASHVRVAFHEIAWRDPRVRAADNRGVRWHQGSLM